MFFYPKLGAAEAVDGQALGAMLAAESNAEGDLKEKFKQCLVQLGDTFEAKATGKPSILTGRDGKRYLGQMVLLEANGQAWQQAVSKCVSRLGPMIGPTTQEKLKFTGSEIKIEHGSMQPRYPKSVGSEQWVLSFVNNPADVLKMAHAQASTDQVAVTSLLLPKRLRELRRASIKVRWRVLAGKQLLVEKTDTVENAFAGFGGQSQFVRSAKSGYSFKGAVSMPFPTHRWHNYGYADTYSLRGARNFNVKDIAQRLGAERLTRDRLVGTHVLFTADISDIDVTKITSIDVSARATWACKEKSGAWTPCDGIAIVNGVVIPQAQYDEEYKRMTAKWRERKRPVPLAYAAKYRDKIINQLIDRSLLEQAADKAKITVSTSSIEGAFIKFRKMFRTSDKFNRYLRKSGIKAETIKANIKHSLRVKKLVLPSGTQLTPDDARQYYRDNLKTYFIKPQVRASHIFVEVDPKSNENQKRAAQKRIGEIYRKATRKGAMDFPILAKLNTDDTNNPFGDLGYLEQGKAPPAFDNAAFALREGQISKPVRTPSGWHIIKIFERQEGRQQDFEEVKARVIETIQAKEVREAKTAYLGRARQDGLVIVNLEGYEWRP